MPINHSRNALLAKVHLAPKELGLDEDTRRAIQKELTGKDSAARMSVAELERLVRHYRSLGWRPRGRGGRPRATAQVRMIRALWHELAEAGVVRAPEGRREKALRAWVKRQTGVSAPEWLTPEQASAVIEMLKKWCARVGAEAER